MLKTDFGWQGIVSSVWVISWNDRVEGGRVLKDLRCGELDLGVRGGGRVIFVIRRFFDFPWSLDIVDKGSSPAVASPSSSRGTSW